MTDFRKYLGKLVEESSSQLVSVIWALIVWGLLKLAGVSSDDDVIFVLLLMVLFGLSDMRKSIK